MNLPKLDNRNLNNYLDREEIVQETAEQIMKDFGMFGIEITFSGNISNAYSELHTQLTHQIEYMLAYNSDKLYSVLYQVDISDRGMARTAIDLPHYNHIQVIAHQIIFRDLQKVLTRRYFKSNR
jgi:hypothetical protein